MSPLQVRLDIPSPIHKLDWDLFKQHNINVWIKRDDLIHPIISGNKWRKLKHNFAKAKSKNIDHLVSFGGAFSNHVHAISLAAKVRGFKLTLFIRSYIEDPSNPTLQFAKSHGAELVFVEPKYYRDKEKNPKIQGYLKNLDDYYLIPEGGYNVLGSKGTQEIVPEILDQCPYTPDYFVVASGTGTTAKGILETLPKSSRLLVFNALKQFPVEQHINPSSNDCDQLTIISDDRFGGFAKTNKELVHFINDVYKKYEIPLDPIYNSKLLFGFMEMVKDQYFKPNSKIVLIHTGGLQGITAHNYRYHNKPNMKINFKV